MIKQILMSIKNMLFIEIKTVYFLIKKEIYMTRVTEKIVSMFVVLRVGRK